MPSFIYGPYLMFNPHKPFHIPFFFSYQTYDYCLNLIDPFYFIPFYLFDPLKPFSLSQTFLSYFLSHKSFDSNFPSHLSLQVLSPLKSFTNDYYFQGSYKLVPNVLWLSLLPFPWPWPPYELMMQLWGSHLYKPTCKLLTLPKNYIGMYLLHPSLQLQTNQN